MKIYGFLLILFALNFCSSKNVLPEEKPIIQIRFYLADEEKKPDSLVLFNEKGESFPFKKEAFVTEKDIISVKLTDGIFRRYDILIELNPEGTKKLQEITSQNLKKKIAITIDGKIMIMPIIQHEIKEGKAMITGEKDENATKEIVKKINQIILKQKQ